VSATASDNIGVARVEFLIDGSVATTDYAAPYGFSWNASSILGSHTVAARAFDAAGNSATTPGVSVSVTAPPPPPSDSIPFPAVVRDNFNVPDGSVPGRFKWTPIINIPFSGSMAIVSNAIEPTGSLLGDFGGIVWDSLMSGGTEAGMRILQKTGVYDGSSLFIYAKMNSTDFLTGTGYRLRFWEEPGPDLIEIHRVGPGYTVYSVLAATNVEVNQGDTLTFRVLADNKTLVGLINGVKVIEAVDSTYNPSQWYFALRGINSSLPLRLDDFKVSTPRTVSGVAPTTDAPQEYSLEQNFPNPFNPSTVINYTLPYVSRVKLRIYNVLGQEVSSLVNSIQSSGRQSARWSADNNDGYSLPSGIYYYKLEAVSLDDPTKSLNQVRKMIYLK
jgi:hypothetical protein